MSKVSVIFSLLMSFWLNTPLRGMESGESFELPTGHSLVQLLHGVLNDHYLSHPTLSKDQAHEYYEQLITVLGVGEEEEVIQKFLNLVRSGASLISCTCNAHSTELIKRRIEEGKNGAYGWGWVTIPDHDMLVEKALGKGYRNLVSLMLSLGARWPKLEEIPDAKGLYGDGLYADYRKARSAYLALCFAIESYGKADIQEQLGILKSLNIIPVWLRHQQKGVSLLHFLLSQGEQLLDSEEDRGNDRDVKIDLVKEMVDLFKESGGYLNIEHDCGDKKFSRLSIPIFLEYLEELEQALDNYASNDCLDEKSHPLIFAVKNGNSEIIKKIIEKGEISGNVLAEALRVVIRKPLTEIVEILLEKVIFEEPVLHDALLEAHYSCVNSLVAKGANVNKSSVKGVLPLCDAATRNNVKKLDALLNCGARVNDAQESDGRTALHNAVIAKSTAAVKFLISTGADPSKQDKRKKDALAYVTSSSFEIKRMIENALAAIERQKKREQKALRESFSALSLLSGDGSFSSSSCEFSEEEGNQ